MHWHKLFFLMVVVSGICNASSPDPEWMTQANNKSIVQPMPKKNTFIFNHCSVAPLVDYLDAMGAFGYLEEKAHMVAEFKKLEMEEKQFNTYQSQLNDHKNFIASSENIQSLHIFIWLHKYYQDMRAEMNKNFDENCMFIMEGFDAKQDDQ